MRIPCNITVTTGAGYADKILHPSAKRGIQKHSAHLFPPTKDSLSASMLSTFSLSLLLWKLYAVLLKMSTPKFNFVNIYKLKIST